MSIPELTALFITVPDNEGVSLLEAGKHPVLNASARCCIDERFG